MAKRATTDVPTDPFDAPTQAIGLGAPAAATRAFPDHPAAPTPPGPEAPPYSPGTPPVASQTGVPASPVRPSPFAGNPAAGPAIPGVGAGIPSAPSTPAPVPPAAVPSVPGTPVAPAPVAPAPLPAAGPSPWRAPAAPPDAASHAGTAAQAGRPQDPWAAQARPDDTPGPPIPRDGGDGGTTNEEPPVSGKPAKRPPIPALIVTALLALSVVAGLVFTWRLGILPTGMFALAAGADLVLAGVIAFGLFRSPLPAKKAAFTVLTVLAVVAMVANLAVVKVTRDVGRAIGGGFEAPKTVSVLYDVIGLTTGPSAITQLDGTTMGELALDASAAQAREAVLKLVHVDFATQPDTGALAAALTAGDIGSAVIIDDFLQLYQEYDPDFYRSVKIIATFRIDVADTTAPPPGTPGASGSPDASATEPALAPNPSGTFVVYISGIDTYGPVAARARSDVNQLVVVNTKTGQVLLVNTPRDYYVQLHGKPGLKDKLTHAGIYGIQTSIGTLQDLYGITIDHYVRLNFDSVVKLIDTLGGVDITSDVAFTTKHGGLKIVKGVNHLDGQGALAYVRERYAVAGGDRGRGKDQQALIQAVLKKLMQPSVLVRYDAILKAAQTCVQTSIPSDVLTGLAKTQLSTNTAWNFSTYSVDGSDGSEFTYSYTGQKLYVMIPAQATVDTAKQKIAATLAG